MLFERFPIGLTKFVAGAVLLAFLNLIVDLLSLIARLLEQLQTSAFALVRLRWVKRIGTQREDCFGLRFDGPADEVCDGRDFPAGAGRLVQCAKRVLIQPNHRKIKAGEVVALRCIGKGVDLCALLSDERFERFNETGQDPAEDFLARSLSLIEIIEHFLKIFRSLFLLFARLGHLILLRLLSCLFHGL